MSDAPRPAEIKGHDLVIPRGVFLPFCLVTTLFAFWGFANDVTNPLVRAFESIFLISSAESSLVQTAFYGGYATMALPAAIFIRRFSYKAGILLGLALYATGALLFIPASITTEFWLFLAALYVLTFGLAFLETTANPYVLAMGPESTATRRLNFAQAFNPFGSLVGMVVASQIVLASLGVQEFREAQIAKIQKAHKAEYEANRAEYEEDRTAYEQELNRQKETLEAQKKALARYEEGSEQHQEALKEYKQSIESLKDRQMATEEKYQPMLPGRIDAKVRSALEAYEDGEIDFEVPVRNERGEVVTDAAGDPVVKRPYENYADLKSHDLMVVRVPYVTIGMVIIGVFVVFAVSRLPKAGGEDRRIHFFTTFGRLLSNGRYVGGVIAQTFYVGAQIMCWTFIIHYATINLNMSFSEAQLYNTVAMAIFCSSQFLCTYLLKYVSPGGLLASLAIGGIATTTGAIFLPGMAGLYCLMAISACMSLMFPTIYGIALDGLGEDAKLGSAGLIFGIAGGAIFPPLQGYIKDLGDPITGNVDLGFTTLPAVNASFFLPVGCFVVIAIYGFLTHNRRQAQA